MKTSLLLSPLTLLLLTASLFSISAAPTLPNAIAILSDSGYESMSHSLDLAADSLDSNPTLLTIFAPSDDAFAAAGQPSLDILRLHLVPDLLEFTFLTSKPIGFKINTLLHDGPITITSVDSPSDEDDDGGGATVTLNNVTVGLAQVIYNDGSLIIYGIDKFFELRTPIRGRQEIRGCLAPPINRNSGDDDVYEEKEAAPFGEASMVLRLRGFTVMAVFLEMRFVGVAMPPTEMLTVFAPADRVLISHVSDMRQYSSVLLRHAVPCRLSSSDLTSLEDGSVLRTNLQGFTITVSRNGSVSEVNGVPVLLTEIYQNGWLVVHGIGDILLLPQLPAEPHPQLQVMSTSTIRHPRLPPASDLYPSASDFFPSPPPPPEACPAQPYWVGFSQWFVSGVFDRLIDRAIDRWLILPTNAATGGNPQGGHQHGAPPQGGHQHGAPSHGGNQNSFEMGAMGAV